MKDLEYKVETIHDDKFNIDVKTKMTIDEI